MDQTDSFAASLLIIRQTAKDIERSKREGVLVRYEDSLPWAWQ